MVGTGVLIALGRVREFVGRSWRRWVKSLVEAVVFVAVCCAAVWLAVQVTPMQSVAAAGQTVRVGAVQGSPTGSGPGELDLFGQAIPTKPHFTGPIRPRLELARITIDAQVDDFVKSGEQGAIGLTSRLTDGWRRYCLWETLVAAGFATVVFAAVTALRHWSRATKVRLIGAGVACAVALNSLCVYLLASSTPQALDRVRTINDLVGRSPDHPVPAAKGPTLEKVQAVVIGDSTAAGIGNPRVDDPTALDRACGRSQDAYAVYLGEVNNWDVLNLACSGATVAGGLLGVQILGHQVAPPQLSEAQRASRASVIIVSVGANDVHWADLTKLCLAAKACGDKASTAYFQQQLATFSQQLYDLMRQLAALPQHPIVLVNQYYDPLGPDVGCLRADGITPAMASALHGRLGDLNAVLAKAAGTFGFHSVQPHFGGHTLCTHSPFVQGPGAEAPLHPTASGELAIALADQQMLATILSGSGSSTSLNP
jgi:lysophospholipase L1-like esterase